MDLLMIALDRKNTVVLFSFYIHLVYINTQMKYIIIKIYYFIGLIKLLRYEAKFANFLPVCYKDICVMICNLFV